MGQLHCTLQFLDCELVAAMLLCVVVVVAATIPPIVRQPVTLLVLRLGLVVLQFAATCTLHNTQKGLSILSHGFMMIVYDDIEMIII